MAAGAKSPFFRNVLMLVSGNAAVQAINIGILPVLTRLYDPSAFGIVAFYTTLLTIVTIFSTGKLEAAIIPAASDRMAWNLVLAITLLSATFAIAAGLVSYAIWLARPDLPLSPGLSLLAMFHVFITGPNLALYAWLNRHAVYAPLSQGRIAGAVALAACATAAGLAGAAAEGLVLGTVLGLITNVVWMLAAARRRGLAHGFDSWPDIKAAARDNGRYARFLIPSGVLERISSQLHLLSFTPVFGPAVAGAIGLHDRVVSMPISLVGRAIGDVFRQRANEELNANGECRELFILTARRLALLALPPFIALLALGPWMFAFVFGPEWRLAGEFARILSPVFLLGFVVSPLSGLFYLAGYQRYDLIMQLYLLTVLALAVGAGILLQDVRFGLGAFSFAYCTKYLIELRLAYGIANGRALTP